MRLPQLQLESVCFLFNEPSELILAMGSECLHDEAAEIQRLFELGLPPVTSKEALSVMLGYNPGFTWSLLKHTQRYYRHFSIPKGAGLRDIEAPRVALKAIQKWLSHHFQRAWKPNEHVFGFVPGRSHIGAAAEHLSSEWVYSVDIENFFPSVPIRRVCDALRFIGYQTEQSVEILSTLCCLNHRLVQGAPTSPIISNIVLRNLDERLAEIAAECHAVFTRYADDIVFSGRGAIPEATLRQIRPVVTGDGWTISERKLGLSKLPNRLKIHGLLVHGERLRLTKGYRNRIRAYRHLLKNKKIKEDDLRKINGHLNYASQIEKSD